MSKLSRSVRIAFLFTLSCLLPLTSTGQVAAFYLQQPININPALLCLEATPAVIGISPTSGSNSGGTQVTITGTCLSGVTKVFFGRSAATNVDVVSATEITADSPVGIGIDDVTVENGNGTSATSSADQFSYTTPTTPGTLSIISLDDLSQNPHDNTIYQGDELQVVFGGVSANSISAGSTGTVTLTPEYGPPISFEVAYNPWLDFYLTQDGTAGGQLIPAGDYQLTLVWPGMGSQTQSLGVSPAEPTITGVSPQTGSSSGGTMVTITGTGFSSDMAVVFGKGQSALQVTYVSSTELQALSPPHDPGVVDVGVGNVDVASTPNPSDQFVYEGTGSTSASTSFRLPGAPQGSLYVANTGDGTVSVINAATNVVVSTISLNVGPTFPSGGNIYAHPTAVIANPQGTRVYVSVDVEQGVLDNNCGVLGTDCYPRMVWTQQNGLVAVIDSDPSSANYNSVIAMIPVGPGPGQPALSPDGRYLYVPEFPSNEQVASSGSITSIAVVDPTAVVASLNPSDNAGGVATTFQFSGGGASEVAASPDGHRLYVLESGVVAVVDTDPSGQYGTVIAEVKQPPDGGEPWITAGMTMSPNGRWLYVIGESDFGDKPDAPVEVIDTTQIQPGTNDLNSPAVFARLALKNDSVGCGSSAFPAYETLNGLGMSPDGSYLYVVDAYGPMWIIDTSRIQPGTNLIPTWEVSDQPWPPDGKACPAPSSGDSNSSPVVAALDVGGFPDAVAVSPQGTLYVVQGTDDTTLYLSGLGADVSADEHHAVPHSGAGVTAVIPYTLASRWNLKPGNTDPGNTLGQTSTGPAVSTITVGDYPMAATFVEPPTAVTGQPMPGNTSGGGSGGANGNPGGGAGSSNANGNSPAFNDLGGYNWAAGAINSLASKGIIQGTGSGAFDPAGQITRGQFAALMERAFSLPQPSQSVVFSDVSSSSWAYAPVEAVTSYMNFDQLPGGGNFHPDQAMDRQDVATTMVKILAAGGQLQIVSGSDADTVLASIPDASDIAPSLQPYVATAIKAGLIKGFPDGSFQPQGLLNRAQIAVLLERAQTTFPASSAAASGNGGIVTRPIVTGISPASGSAVGGTTVTITGVGFTGATAVEFGSNPASNFTVVSDTEITATSPAGSGTVDLKVTTPGGTSETVAGDRFAYSG